MRIAITAITAIAIAITFTVLPAAAQWGGIDSSSPRRMTTPEEGNSGVPTQKNPEAVVLGKLGVVENAPKIMADGAKNPRLFVNESPDVVQAAVDNNHDLAMKELEEKAETIRSLRGTAVGQSERDKVYETAARFEKLAAEAKTQEEREFWASEREKELSRLPSKDDMAATIAPASADDEGPGIIFWILVIGIPIVVIAGTLVAVAIARRNDDDDDDDADDDDDDDDDADDDDDDDDDADDDGAAKKPRQRGSRGSGKKGNKKDKDEVISKS